MTLYEGVWMQIAFIFILSDSPGFITQKKMYKIIIMMFVSVKVAILKMSNFFSSLDVQLHSFSRQIHPGNLWQTSSQMWLVLSI